MPENTKEKKVTSTPVKKSGASTTAKPKSTAKPATTKIVATKAKKDSNVVEYDELGMIKEKFDLSYKNKKLVSVTGCAAGIAHTFMAQEGILTAGGKMGVKARVETHGIGGPESILTAKEIREADIVLIAADITVDLTRFIGKKVYVTDTNLALKNPQQLIIDAFTKATEYHIGRKGEVKVQASSEQLQGESHNNAIKHIMFALGWTIPLITSAGLMMAIGNLFSMSVYENLPALKEQLALFYLYSYTDTNALVDGMTTYAWMDTYYTGLVTVNDGITLDANSTISNVTVHYDAYGDYLGSELMTMANDIWIEITTEGTDAFNVANQMFVNDVYLDKVNPGNSYNWSDNPADSNYWVQYSATSIWGFEGKPLAGAFVNIGISGLHLMYPLLAGAIAVSIGTKVAFVPAFIGGWVMNDGTFLGPNGIYTGENGDQAVGTGFIGALIIGFAMGYIMRGLKKIPLHKSIQGIANLMFLPLLGTIIMLFLAKYIIGWPLGLVVAEMYQGLNYIDTEFPNSEILLAIIIGLMIASDMGGPINKTAYIFGAAVMTTSIVNNPSDMTQWNFAPNTAVAAAISVPPIGAFFATQIFGRYFNSSEKTNGVNAGLMGLSGISEGAIPFAISKPVAFIPANMIGGAFASAVAVAFGIQVWGGLGSPLGAFIGYQTIDGATAYPEIFVYWIFATVGGALVTAVIAGLVTMGQTKKSRFALRSKTLNVEMKRQINIVLANVAAGKITESEGKAQISKIKADTAAEIKRSKPLEKEYEKQLSATRKSRMTEGKAAIKQYKADTKPKLAAAKNEAGYNEAYSKMNAELAELKAKFEKAVLEQKTLLKQAKDEDKYKFTDKIVDIKAENIEKIAAIKAKNKYEIQIQEFKAQKTKLSDNVKRVNNTYLNSLQVLEPLSV